MTEPSRSLRTSAGTWYHRADGMADNRTTDPTALPRPRHTLLAILGLAGPALFGLTTLLAAHRHPAYSHTSRFISELAAASSPVRPLMVWLGFLPAGIAFTAFSFSLARHFGPAPGPRAAVLLIRAFGIGATIAGIFPCEPDGSLIAYTVPALVHNTVSAGIFLGICFVPGLSAARLEELEGSRPLLAPYSRFATPALLLTFAATAHAGFTMSPYKGALQRFLLLLVFVWIGGMAALVLSIERGDPRGTSPRAPR